KELREIVAEVAEETKVDLGGFDPGVGIAVDAAEKPAQVLDAADAKRIADLLVTVPHGVIAMSPDIPGLVQTSTNLAVIALKDGQVEIGTSQRSAIEGSKQGARRMVETVMRQAGLETDFDTGYPGW